jgi:hypothetical protein
MGWHSMKALTDANTLILNSPAFITVRNFFSLYITQSLVFCYNKTKWTKTTGHSNGWWPERLGVCHSMLSHTISFSRSFKESSMLRRQDMVCHDINFIDVKLLTSGFWLQGQRNIWGKGY